MGRLPERIDALVLSAGRFSPQRIVTAEGFEQTFAINVVARHLLAHRHLRQPARAVVGATAALFAATPAATAVPLEALLTAPPAAPLTALRRGSPVPPTGPAFDPATAARLYTLLDDLTQHPPAVRRAPQP